MNVGARTLNVGILAASPGQTSRAEALAEETGAPCISLAEFASAEFSAALLCDDEGLALVPSAHVLPGVSPLRIDLAEWHALARRPVSFRQPLARAIGITSRASAPAVLDATAGLLTDALHLAIMGCRVDAIERSPIVHAVAADALRRAIASPALVEAASRITLHHADAATYLTNLTPDRLPSVVYIDPMHPPRDRHVSALVRKEMRILRLVVGDDLDSAQLLTTAVSRLSDPRARVVLKLPLRAEPLAGSPSPAHVHEAKTVRYEVHKPIHAAGSANR